MTESDLWKYVKGGMMGRWHASRIESSAGNGIPDVDFGMAGINGKIELKYIPEWPKRPTTLVKLPLRPDQKIWIKNRGVIAGNVWALIRIKDDFFLLDWKQAVRLYEQPASRFTWTNPDPSTVWKRWHGRIDFHELATILRAGCPGQVVSFPCA